MNRPWCVTARRTRLPDGIGSEETQEPTVLGGTKKAAKKERRPEMGSQVEEYRGRGRIRRGERVAASGRSRIPSRRDRVA